MYNWQIEIKFKKLNVKTPPFKSKKATAPCTIKEGGGYGSRLLGSKEIYELLVPPGKAYQ